MEKLILNTAFIKSLITTENPFMSTDNVLNWIIKRRSEVAVSISLSKFSKLDNWEFDKDNGNLKHISGKFFSIAGIKIDTNWGTVSSWEQPIINQPEVGFLGIITKNIDGVLYFLMQAKIEPGNINIVQISPTLQATKSNYTSVHKGRRPLYLEYFNGEKSVEVLIDQLQSEQGARFFKKRNRNIIIEVKDEIPVYEDFCWLTLGQIKQLLNFDNVINMDTRTVISCINFGTFDKSFLAILDCFNASSFFSKKASFDLFKSLLYENKPFNNMESIISWITNLKTKFELNVEFIGLKNVKDWQIDDTVICHKNKKYFSVIPVDIEISNREVAKWSQPLVKPAQEGLLAFIIKKIDDVYHFLVQAKLELGNLDIIELAPTVQCLTGNYRNDAREYEVPFIDLVLNAKPDSILYSTYQSEEGGRFFQEQNKQMIVEVYDDFALEVPETYIWMTLNQLNTFNKFNNYLNIQARSLLAAVPFI
ncbi:MAG: NDP-hexose 2,3-dehydratase family protein [Bacteroidota bacterium]